MGQVVIVASTNGDTYTHENPKQFSPQDGWLTVEEQGPVGSVLHHYNESNVLRYSVKETPED